MHSIPSNTHTQTFQRWLKTARNSGHECTTFSPHPHSSKKEGRRGRKPLTPRDRKTRPHHAFSSSFRTGCLPPLLHDSKKETLTSTKAKLTLHPHPLTTCPPPPNKNEATKLHPRPFTNTSSPPKKAGESSNRNLHFSHSYKTPPLPEKKKKSNT